MAKEEVLKSVDLKVSVNCCQGCKRKVLKALSIKGILKTEIHPSLPRITVIGNIEVHTLIKKLAKIGKTAELLPVEGPKHESKGSDKETHKGSEEVKTGEGNFTAKSSSKHSNYTDNDRSSKPNSTANGNDNNNNNNNNNKGGDKSTKDIGDSSKTYAPHATMVAAVPHMNCLVNPHVLQNQATLMIPQARVYYPMEGCAVPMQYYTVNACSTTPPCSIRDCCNCELPLVYHPPPMQSQATGLADYFNDDNTAGCRVM